MSRFVREYFYHLDVHGQVFLYHLPVSSFYQTRIQRTSHRVSKTRGSLISFLLDSSSMMSLRNGIIKATNM